MGRGSRAAVVRGRRSGASVPREECLHVPIYGDVRHNQVRVGKRCSSTEVKV